MFKKSAVDLNSAFYPSLHFTLSLQSAFYTQSAFYPWSAVCSLQSAVRSLRFTLTASEILENIQYGGSSVVKTDSQRSRFIAREA